VRRGGSRNASSRLIIELLERKPPKLAAVALANKIASLAWKLNSQEKTTTVKAAPRQPQQARREIGQR
jgi:hypothetical protein